MDKILESAKSFEFLRDRHDPAYADIVRAIEIVKKFISDNGLILYGGTGIDFALRLRGDKIYDDQSLAAPDLDFYSPQSVEHSYQLADTLYSRGFEEVRVIVAMYVRTMRVDLADGHYIADITFCPPEVFRRLPTLEYNGMKIIHPEYQRIDLHSSLSFPYDNPPREVIFDRWKKDIKRWNLLNRYYPIEVGKFADAPIGEVAVEAVMHRYTFTGFAAYAIIHEHWTDLCRRLELGDPPKLAAPAPGFRAGSGGVLRFRTLDRTVEIVHFNIERAAAELKLQGCNTYEPYFGMVYESLVGRVDDRLMMRIHSTHDRFITVNNVKIADTSFKIVNVQPLLRHFIAYANVTQGAVRNAYLAHYASLLAMIQFVEERLHERVSDAVVETLKQSPLFPSTYTYGNENRSMAYTVSLNRLLVDLGRAKALEFPRNYHPSRVVPKKLPHPTFDPESNEFFREAGRLIRRDVAAAPAPAPADAEDRDIAEPRADD